MKFGQLLKYNMKNIFCFENRAKNEAGRLVPDLFCFLRNPYIR